ncbi:hypothetical protein G7009_26805 [Pseudomonas capeferrum]|uniref:hypothetical protein n=1 Tax=Pseudomonas capeferrum TaxID=1495066 RepID=UPI0015E41D17|nr:hypothetical protein [Pseudomonas capeferrum]MBA1205323.1 hypothetical protein [Pseudomonas capeferrum]
MGFKDDVLERVGGFTSRSRTTTRDSGSLDSRHLPTARKQQIDKAFGGGLWFIVGQPAGTFIGVNDDVPGRVSGFIMGSRATTEDPGPPDSRHLPTARKQQVDKVFGGGLWFIVGQPAGTFIGVNDDVPCRIGGFIMGSRASTEDPRPPDSRHLPTVRKQWVDEALDAEL